MQVAEIQAEKTQEFNERLLGHLHRGGAWGYYQSYHISKTYTDKNGTEQRSKNSLWWPVGAAPTLAKLSQVIPQNDVYFGVHPGTVKRKNYERSTIGTIAAVNCFFAEFDAKDFDGSKESTLAHIDSLPYAPSVIIDSGGGFHCYWLLRDTVIVTDENRKDVINNQRAWVEFVGSDDGAKDLARILRVPGTLNHKPEYGEPRPVEYVRHVWARTFKYDDLCIDLAEIVKGYDTKPETESTSPGVAVAITLDDEALLQTMFGASNGAKVQALWRGDMSAYGNDQNRADGGLCCHLAWYTKDAAQIDRLFQRSELYRPKWDVVHYANGQTYGEHTIEGAINKVGSNGYNPRDNGTGAGYRGNDTDGIGDLFGSTVDENGEIIPHPLSFLESNPLGYRAEDGGILDVWTVAYGQTWRYVTGYEIWRKWAETHWELDQDRAVESQVQALTKKLNDLARGESDRIDAENGQIRAANKKNKTEDAEIFNGAKQYIMATKRSAARVRSVVYLAENQRATSAERWDQGNILNLKNGVLDLDTLKLREQTKDDLLTYCLPYEYNEAAKAPEFERFISEVLVKTDEDGNFTGKKDKDGNPTAETDQELVNLFQELWGYTLTTDTSKHAMAWLSGEGSNGKSLALSILQALLGPLALTVNFAELGNPRSYVKSDIPGKRMILSTESERGATIAEGEIRQIASGDRQSTRPIYGSNFQFTPVCTIWWAMNDRPSLKDTSNATWRRLKLIPFNQTFSENPKPGEMQRDTGLQDKLMAELPGILNWAIEGLKRLRLKGQFTPSAAMEKAIAEYKNESNPVDQWREERTGKAKPDDKGILQSVLYQDYTAWCYQNGRHALSSSKFSIELKRLGIRNQRKTEGSTFFVKWAEDETTAPTTEDVVKSPEKSDILQELGL